MRFTFVFKKSTLQYLTKMQVQIIVFNKKLLRKFIWSPTERVHFETFVKYRSEFFLVNVSRIMCWIFLVLIVKSKTIKTPGVYDNAHSLDLSSLTEFSICRLNQVKREHISMSHINVLSAQIRRMNKVHLMGNRK